MSQLTNLTGYTHPGVLSNIRGNAADKPLLVEQAPPGEGVLLVSLSTVPPVGAAAFLWQCGNANEVRALDWDGNTVATYTPAAVNAMFAGTIGGTRTAFYDGSTVTLCDITTENAITTQGQDGQQGIPSQSIDNTGIFMAGYSFDPTYDRRLTSADLDLGSVAIVGLAVPPAATAQFESDFDTVPASVNGLKVAIGSTSFLTWVPAQAGLVTVNFASGEQTQGGGSGSPVYAVNDTRIIRAIDPATTLHPSIEVASTAGAQVQLVEVTTAALTRFMGVVADNSNAIAVLTDETDVFAYYIDLATYAVTDITANFPFTDPGTFTASFFRGHQLLV